LDARGVLLAEHALLHAAAVARADGPQVADLIWRTLSEAQMRESLPGHNSAAWILWHLARWEDVHVNVLARDLPEVLDRGGWLERLRIDERDCGTGANDEEMAGISDRIDLPALRDYRDAVARETRDWLENLTPESLDEVVDQHARAARAPAFYDPGRASWVLGAQDRSIAGLLLWGVIGHGFAHLGDASHVRTLLGLPSR
jgi:hypothetical protein